MTIAGIPGIPIGVTDRHAWTWTTGGTDNNDLYVESLNPDNPSQYFFGGGFVDLDCRLETILVAGGSGADEDMMRGNTLAAVVGNRHHEELSQLVDQERIYFAGQPHATGILEAIEHYDFFRACQVPQEA